MVFRHACKLGFEGIVSKRLGSPYRSGPSRDWTKTKDPAAPAVKREAEEDYRFHNRGITYRRACAHARASLMLLSIARTT